jgi:hypothetical protein
MKSDYFLRLVTELADEDPFALRGVLRLLSIEMTTEVETLAVTCEARPRLLVNLEFVTKNCLTDDEVKAVLCHEFLHVLLRHTEQLGRLTHARHLAFDAVINAIIHRTLGPRFSSLMSRYYANEKGLRKLLRPPTALEQAEVVSSAAPAWRKAWWHLYSGHLVADDLESLANDLQPRECGAGNWLGNHEDLGRKPGGALGAALDQALRRMNGEGIWRSPKSRGAGASSYNALVLAADRLSRAWEKKTLAVLVRHLQPDPRSRANEEQPVSHLLPVLSPGDRRAFLRSLWQPFLPEARWKSQAQVRTGTAQIYLDVSGSMSAEMPLIVALLARLSKFIRRPFWAFSDRVSPANIVQGQLRTATTGGTSLSCVLEHLAETKPRCAVIVTDGHVEPIDPARVRALGKCRLHALVTRDGDPTLLRAAGISYTQLARLPR